MQPGTRSSAALETRDPVQGHRAASGETALAELERENQRLRDELTKARVIIDVQKKVSGCWVSAPQDKSGEKSGASCQTTRAQHVGPAHACEL